MLNSRYNWRRAYPSPIRPDREKSTVETNRDLSISIHDNIISGKYSITAK